MVFLKKSNIIIGKISKINAELMFYIVEGSILSVFQE